MKRQPSPVIIEVADDRYLPGVADEPDAGLVVVLSHNLFSKSGMALSQVIHELSYGTIKLNCYFGSSL